MNTQQSYNLTVAALICMLVAICGILAFGSKSELGLLLVGLLMLTACGAGVVGSWYAYKGFNEPTSKRKIFAMTVNFIFLILIVAVLLTNIMDILKWL